MVESFWAVPDVTEIRTPMNILREQASALTEQTQGTLVGIVDVRNSDSGRLAIGLEVSVPALNEYRYRIFSYDQPIEMYPGTLWYGDRGFAIPNEKSFIDTVKAALSSEKVKNVLTSLLSQARDA